MNIGIITSTYPPNLNGVSISVKLLADGLNKLPGHNCFLVIPRIENADYPDNILPVRSVRVPKAFSPDIKIPYLYKKKAFEFFESNNVQIVHSNDPFFAGKAGVKISKALGVPHVHTYHTMLEEYKYVNVPGRARYLKNLSKKTCNKSSAVIAPSQKIKDYLLSIGVTRPISVIHNPPNIVGLKPVPKNTTFASQLGIKDNDFVFITLGRVAREKNIDLAISILAPLIKKYSNIKYIISGIGTYFDELKQVAEKLGISESVIFTGKYTKEDIPGLASLADYFLFTSTTDVQPSTILESMACGVPVISIDDPGVDFILQDKINGFKVQKDRLARVCEEVYLNRELRRSLSDNSVLIASEFIKNFNIEEYINFYREVCDRFSDRV